MLTSSVFSLSYLSVYLAMLFALDSPQSDYSVFVTAAIRFQIPLNSELLGRRRRRFWILFYTVFARMKRAFSLFVKENEIFDVFSCMVKNG